MVLTDAKGTIHYVNPAFTRITGWRAEEALGQNPRILKSDRTPPETYVQLWNTLLRGEPWSGRVINRRKRAGPPSTHLEDANDGSSDCYWADLTISPVRDDAGAIVGYVGIHRDVTELQNREEQLQHQSDTERIINHELLAINELQRALYLARTAEDVARVVSDALVQRFDAHFARVWLKRPGDLCNACALADHCPAHTECLHLISSSGCYTHVDGPHRRVPLGAFKIGLIAQGRGKTISNDVVHDERVHDRPWAQREGLVSFAGLPLTRDGRIIGVMAMFSRKPLADHRLETLDILAQLCCSALANVEQIEALEQARRAADAASHAKSEFLANVSHELRTPLTAILGFADTLHEPQQREAESLDAVRIIQRNGEYLLGLINDILDLTKIEAEKMTVEQIRCHPCQVVADVASLVRVRTDAKGLSFKVEYTGDIPETIQTDPTRLRQILLNMISNAVKFTEVGGVRLVTRLVRRCDGRALMQFDVIDTGIGMTADQVARLFSPFTQADTSTTRRFGGTGLGLVISRRLARLLGGDLSVVDSQPGLGTRFRATVAAGALDGVPMLPDPARATVVGPERTSPDRGEVTLPPCRVLLAEDGPDNQQLIGYILRKAGASVTLVETGRAAVDAVFEAAQACCPFDVVLMDMQMPLMDGYSAARELRRRGYGGRIIALTAHAMSGDRDKCIAAGCDDYATKPIDRPAILRAIARCLEAQPVG